jgi:hypothetical protein
MVNNNKVKTIAEIIGLDISRFKKEMIKTLNRCGIEKRPDNNLSDIDWVKQFEIMTAGNFKNWKIAYQSAYESKYGK